MSDDSDAETGEENKFIADWSQACACAVPLKPGGLICWVNSFIVCWAVTYFYTTYCDTTIPAKHDLVKFEVNM